MRIRVLGSAAGGGFPQWNCGCPNCAGVRSKEIRASARTQACVAVSSDGDIWVLLGASPDIRFQIEGFPPLHPRGLRHSPIAGILFNNGDLDQCLGLLSLRESQPLQIYSTDRVRQAIVEGNVWARAINRFSGHVAWRPLKLFTEQPLTISTGRGIGLTITAIPVPGKVPLYLEGYLTPGQEDNVGLLITDTDSGQRLAYLPSVAAHNADVERLLRVADCVFFDGTFWSNEELASLGIGRRAEEMAHWPLSGADGSLATLCGIAAKYRILIHINNTNPILQEDSLQRKEVEAAGILVAYDGMDVVL